MGWILGILGVLILIGVLTWRVISLNSEAKTKPDVQLALVTASASKPVATHGSGHGGGHGHSWSFADGVIVTMVVVVGVPAIFVLWWFLAPLSSAPQVSVTAHQSAGTYNAEPVDTNCLFTLQPQACMVGTGGKALVLASGLRSGLTFCITPGVDEATLPEEQRVYKSVTRILVTGASPAYTHGHLEIGDVMGYVLVPKKPMIVRQFVAETPDVAGC